MNKCFKYVDRTDNWETPKDILNYFFNNGYIDFIIEVLLNERKRFKK